MVGEPDAQSEAAEHDPPPVVGRSPREMKRAPATRASYG